MPQVGNKHYSYTPKGKAQAARAKKRQSLADAMEGAQKVEYQNRARGAAMRGGYDAPGDGGYAPPSGGRGDYAPPTGRVSVRDPGRKPKRGYRPPVIGTKKKPNYGGSDR